MTNSLDLLRDALERNHYKNKNGCWVTDYHKIPGLRVLASTTNGDSGIGVYRRREVYWHRVSGLKWNWDTRNLDRVSDPHFEVEWK